MQFTEDRASIIANLEACWASIAELTSGLSDADFAVPSLCPDWTVHGVLSHFGAVESMLVGWTPSVDDPPDFGVAGQFMTDAAGWSGPELVDRLAGVFDTRRGELAATTDDDFALPSFTPVGPQTYGRFMAVREFDFWVHERDMRIPLDRPAADDGGPAAAMALDEVHRSLGYIVGKKIGLPDGKSIRFELTGPVQRDIYAAVDGRAAAVDHVDDPDVTVTTDSVTFTMLACGRIDPQAQIDDGKITWSGDAEWGEQAARNLAFTM